MHLWSLEVVGGRTIILLQILNFFLTNDKQTDIPITICSPWGITIKHLQILPALHYIILFVFKLRQLPGIWASAASKHLLDSNYWSIVSLLFQNQMSMLKRKLCAQFSDKNCFLKEKCKENLGTYFENCFIWSTYLTTDTM